ncbi:hypothetical protein Hanom_Chr02g00144171 [Helianthus anomalus]
MYVLSSLLTFKSAIFAHLGFPVLRDGQRRDCIIIPASATFFLFKTAAYQEYNKTKHPQLFYEAKLYNLLQGGSICGGWLRWFQVMVAIVGGGDELWLRDHDHMGL